MLWQRKLDFCFCITENVSGGGIGKVAFVILGRYFGLSVCLVSQVSLYISSNPNCNVLSFFYCHAEMLVFQVQDKLGGIFKCKIWTKPYK